jgi:hypothetical protein
VAAKIVAAIPSSMDLVMAVTNPWITLAGVGVVTVGAMGIALARLMSARSDVEGHVHDVNAPDDTPPNGDAPPGSVQPAQAAPTKESVAVDDVLTDMAEIAKWVHVVIATDGSVTVEGIPGTVPPELREVVARVAADTAIGHVERTLRVRPTPSRSDRRLFTKAAREALVAQAKRRKHGPEQQAA